MKGRQMSLRGKRYDDEIKENRHREPGEPVRLIGEISIDRSVFKHGPGEKALLKELKAQCKREQLNK